MNGLAATLFTVFALALLVVPRRFAPVALLAGVCYMPDYVGLQFGALNFSAVRLLLLVGVLRVVVRGERSIGGIGTVDRAMLLWAVWLLLSSFFHNDTGSAFTYRMGLAYDALGVYFLVRAHCRSAEDVTDITRATALLLVPLALAMLYEKLFTSNPFATLGGVGATPIIREGKVRASGPFGHPILAGTVGGVLLPVMIGLWRSHRSRSVLGILACTTIVLCSASSGPILSAAAGVFALYLWRYRHRMRKVQWIAVATYILLDIVMKDPAYFIIARIDLAGGSTSWYRARLIQSAFEHFSEWWLAGTDYTRDWMWVVVSWSPNHTDITSHYIQLGVWGGMPLLLLFILTLWRGFGGVTRLVSDDSTLSADHAFRMWTLGAMLFSIAVTGLSVSYFDQTYTLIYITLGMIASAAGALAEPVAEPHTGPGVQGARPLVPTALGGPTQPMQHRRSE